MYQNKLFPFYDIVSYPPRATSENVSNEVILP